MVYLKKYSFFIFTIILLIIYSIFFKEKALLAIDSVGLSLKEMAFFIPPIFILLGLLDVWVPRDVMVLHMGEKSGIRGIIIALAMGSFAAGPLYGAFPVAAVLMKKGAKIQNVLIFIGAWSTTKVPMFLFEYASLGARFALTRLVIDIPGIILMAYVLVAITKKRYIDKLYEKVQE